MGTGVFTAGGISLRWTRITSRRRRNTLHSIETRFKLRLDGPIDPNADYIYVLYIHIYTHIRKGA